MAKNAQLETLCKQVRELTSKADDALSDAFDGLIKIENREVPLETDLSRVTPETVNRAMMTIDLKVAPVSEIHLRLSKYRILLRKGVDVLEGAIHTEKSRLKTTDPSVRGQGNLRGDFVEVQLAKESALLVEARATLDGLIEALKTIGQLRDTYKGMAQDVKFQGKLARGEYSALGTSTELYGREKPDPEAPASLEEALGSLDVDPDALPEDPVDNPEDILGESQVPEPSVDEVAFVPSEHSEGAKQDDQEASDAAGILGGIEDPDPGTTCECGATFVGEDHTPRVQCLGCGRWIDPTTAPRDKIPVEGKGVVLNSTPTPDPTPDPTPEPEDGPDADAPLGEPEGEAGPPGPEYFARELLRLKKPELTDQGKIEAAVQKLCSQYKPEQLINSVAKALETTPEGLLQSLAAKRAPEPPPDPEPSPEPSPGEQAAKDFGLEEAPSDSGDSTDEDWGIDLQGQDKYVILRNLGVDSAGAALGINPMKILVAFKDAEEEGLTIQEAAKRMGYPGKIDGNKNPDYDPACGLIRDWGVSRGVISKDGRRYKLVEEQAAQIGTWVQEAVERLVQVAAAKVESEVKAQALQESVESVSEDDAISQLTAPVEDDDSVSADEESDPEPQEKKPLAHRQLEAKVDENIQIDDLLGGDEEVADLPGLEAKPAIERDRAAFEDLEDKKKQDKPGAKAESDPPVEKKAETSVYSIDDLL